MNIQPLLVRSEMSVRDAMLVLDRTALGVLLLIDDDDRLVRTVTDGDIRRLLIGGGTLDNKLASLPALTPTTTHDGGNPTAALGIMTRLVIDQLPVVDADGHPVDLLLRRDLDAQILLSTPHMGNQEIAYIESAFRSNWIAPLGPNVDAFEQELAAHVGCGHAAALVSGTAAIHIALRLLEIGAGDRVFCSTLTFVATANPILYQGGEPVFVDSEPGTWNMSPQALERAFADAERTGRMPKAVIVVNLYGQSADMDAILSICRKHKVPVVEDAAESLGATYRQRASGTFGCFGIYSFNGNKIITTSGGGMIVSDNAEMIAKVRFLATQARDPAPYYQHSQVGYNYRMSNVLAGIGRGQLRVLSERVAARRAIFQRYAAALHDVPAISWMPEADFGSSTRWLTACTLDSAAVTPADFIQRLAQEKIEARHVWKPLHIQPLFVHCDYFSHEPGRSVADDLFLRGVCLPSSSNMNEAQQDRIIRAIRQILKA